MKERDSLRRSVGVIVFCASLALVAAAPRPLPSAPSTPAPIFTPDIHIPIQVPTVLIYPFDTASGMDSKLGRQVAQLFSQEFLTLGHVSVLPVPSGVQRSQFLNNARTHSADYYISGYLTPIGAGAAIVVQVVSVQSGVIIDAQSAQLYGVNDAVSVALNIHERMMQYSGAEESITTTESATAAPSPVATHGAQYNINNIFGGHGHGHTTAGPVASPTPQAKPQRGVILLNVRGVGTVDEATLNQATQLLLRNLYTHFNVAQSGVAPANLVTGADSICGANRDNTIATGTLQQQHVGGMHARLRSVFTLQVWTCFGAVLYQTTESNDDIVKAVSAAVSDYVTGHPGNS